MLIDRHVHTVTYTYIYTRKNIYIYIYIYSKTVKRRTCTLNVSFRDVVLFWRIFQGRNSHVSCSPAKSPRNPNLDFLPYRKV